MRAHVARSIGVLLMILLIAARAVEPGDLPSVNGTGSAHESAAALAQAECCGPATGWLVIAGGGDLGPEILGRFLALAGGPAAPIVVIPTATAGNSIGNDIKPLDVLRKAGATNLGLLHTRSREEANTAQFVQPLRAARGVWIGGGRQWRLADAYLGTLVEKELHALLQRGGVIGGSSAGASIQASYLVRGAPEGNHILMAPGHERGFAFLHNAAVDQHLLARHREDDLLSVIRAHPALLGIGLDEGTAVIVQGSRLEVVGKSKVAIYNAKQPSSDGKPYLMLSPGSKFDLKNRRLP